MDKIKYILILVLSLSFLKLNAQCCGAGNPISISNVDQSINRKNLQISFDYRHSKTDTYYEGSNVSDFDFLGKLKYAKYDFMNLGVGYGITNRLTIQGQLGYYIQKKEDFINENIPDVTASGIGDLALNLSYVLFRDLQRGIELTPFVIVKFPIGKFDCESEGVKLPISMQPSSGSFKYSAGFSFYSNISQYWYITTYGLYEYAQRIVSNNFDYQYGDLFYFNVAAFCRPTENLSLGLQFAYEFQDRAKSRGEILVGTKYNLLRITPSIMYKLSKQWQLACFIEVPIWRKVESIQMSNKWALQTKIIYNINLKKRY